MTTNQAGAIRVIFLSPDGRVRPGWRFLIVLPLFFTAQNVAARIASALGDGNELVTQAVFQTLATLFLAGLFALMLRWFDRVRGNLMAAQGLGTRSPWLRESFFGLLLGTGMVALAVASIAVVGGYTVTATLNASTLKQALLVLWLLSFGAMLEEVSFRGYPFQRLMEGVGTGGAILIMSALFGLGHIFNPHVSAYGLVNTILVGLVLAFAYLRTRALWLPFGIHLGWNFALGVIFGLPVSGLTFFSVVVQGTATGPKWLTGGDYGIEESLTGAIVIALGFIALTACFPKRAISAPPSDNAGANAGIETV